MSPPLRPRYAGKYGEAMRLGGEAGAEDGFDFVGRAGAGEEIALADAAAGIGEEFALRVVLDALGDDFEVQAAGEGDQGAGEAGALGVAGNAGDEPPVDADRAGAKALQQRQGRITGAEVVDAEARAAGD